MFHAEILPAGSQTDPRIPSFLSFNTLLPNPSLEIHLRDGVPLSHSDLLTIFSHSPPTPDITSSVILKFSSTHERVLAYLLSSMIQQCRLRLVSDMITTGQLERIVAFTRCLILPIRGHFFPLSIPAVPQSAPGLILKLSGCSSKGKPAYYNSFSSFISLP
jgi:hypothetical protein